ncbi:MAG: hypothetical protein Q7K44_03990 [Candidatus Liptonbacteria bacterium]|nr:hypothetical protein [Candidatus Liptonbacteria bacterium]
MKKALIILIFILVVVALGFGGYYLRSRQESATAPTQTTNTLPPAQTAENQASTAQQTSTTQNQPAGAIGGSKLNIISQSQALDYSVDKGSNAFILQPDGRVIRMSGGKAESLSSTTLASITSASFSSDGKRIAAYASDSLSGNKIHIFDTEKKIWSLFPNAAQSFSWSPDSHKIAYLSLAGGINTVYIADGDNSRVKPSELIKIRGEDITISWPVPSTIFLGDRPNSAWNSSLWSLNISKKTISPVLTDLPGLETAWGSSTTQSMGLAFSSGTNGNGGKLQLINQDGKKLRTFDFITFPSKCVFYDKPVPQDSIKPSSATSTSTKTVAPVVAKSFLTLVCAIPRNGDTLNNSPLPDAYLKKALFASDDFFEINVSSGEIKSVFSDSSKNLDADDVKIFNQSVFFINRYDKKVYSIALPK